MDKTNELPEEHESDTEKYRRAKKKVEELKGFYSHLGIYILINLILFAVNAIISFGNWWFYWVTIFWGIGVLIHGATVFGGHKFFSREWEEEKIRHYMDEEQK